MIIEVHSFRLVAGTDEAAFLAADERVQVEVAPFIDGFVRRTTAKAEDGEWLVETLWQSMESAQAGEDATASHEFTKLIDSATVSRRRYASL